MKDRLSLYQTPEISAEASIELVDRWLVRAIDGLLSNWDDNSGNFWRDSLLGESDASDHDDNAPDGLGRGKGATSNNRAFQALISSAYFLRENADLAGGVDYLPRVQRAARKMVTEYFARPLEDLRNHGENQENPYTDSQLLISLSLALSPVTAEACEIDLDETSRASLLQNLKALATELAAEVSSDGVHVHPNAVSHHFLTLHAARALDSAARTLERLSPQDAAALARPIDDGALMESLKTEMIQQLGMHLMPSPGFDSSSLISCCALVARFNGDAESPTIQRAVDALVSEQSERGTWSNAGVLSFGRRRLVYVPSIELSLVLVNIAMLDLRADGGDVFRRSLPALESSFKFVQSSFLRGGNNTSGWRNDRTISGYEVESWTTAVVLQFLLAYRDVLTLGRQEAILRKYRAERQPAPFNEFWPDLVRLIPTASRARRLLSKQVSDSDVAAFSSVVDPTSNNGLVGGIQREIIEPTLTSLCERPVDTASFMLYGPPGTRKTSLVRKAARVLGWPLLTLSPPAFLKAGIEGFEATADEIFEDLQHLRRVVVLFDECEEFFRWRPPTTTIESRTVGAFITAGMLPRLQRLRDTNWIVFVINSNTEAFELDDAVTRRGRLDKAARVGHPVFSAQMRYLQSWRSLSTHRPLSSNHIEWFNEHLSEVDERMDRIREQFEKDRKQVQIAHPNRGAAYRKAMTRLESKLALELKELVTFSTLDALAMRCLGEGGLPPISSSASLLKNLKQEFERFGPDRFATLEGSLD